MGTNVSCLIVRRIYHQNKFFTSGTSASISIDCNKTNAGRSSPWCWDDAAQSVLGVTSPQVMQSAASQLNVVCKKTLFSYIGRTPPITRPHR